MSDNDNEVTIEINAPPKSIEIETSPETNQPAMLTGGIGQMPQGTLLSASPENVKFVMGPDGQLIAMQKPPFIWKHFWIGGGIPFALYFIPLMIAMIGTGLGYEDNWGWETVELTQDENSTRYEGEFTIDSDQTLEWCHFIGQEDQQLYCEDYGENARLFYPDWDGEWVGNWSNGDGVVYFDTGQDYGSTVEIEFEYRKDSAVHQFFSDIEEIAAVTCCLGFFLSIVMLIVGFSQGKPGMGWGGVSALAALPVIGILSGLFMGW